MTAPVPAAAAKRQALLALMHAAGALQFGAFTLRSGRVSPYFFNSARFQTGAQLAALGEHYAAAIERCAPRAGVVFGPAYKGIPLCAAAAMALSRRTGREIGYLFNRKEAKTHGDAGRFVGREPGPAERIVMVDDVITDGGTKLEAVALLREAFSAPIDALVIAFNRMEADASGADAVARFEDATGIPVVPLLTVADVEAALGEGVDWAGATEGGAPALLAQIRDYRRRYGVGGSRGQGEATP